MWIKMKIFIGPCEIAGYCYNLKKGFKSFGIDVKSWFRTTYIWI
ncbi:hypothetical protein MSIBF_A230003 [groundwater metagenome]|uniref:Uncharacterized protein n=1 Tax=groundwater metagenome TaxID=717931 RepID=A0A098E8T5_9ZZZZ